MKKRSTWAAALAAGLLGSGALAADTPLDQLLAARPGVQAFEWDGRLSRLYGAPMAFGVDPEDSAWNFLERHAAVFGADLTDLRQVPNADGLVYQPVMYDRGSGEFKFFAVYFTQVRHDVRVFDSNLTLLVRNDRAAGYPVVLAVNNLQDLSTYNQPQQVILTSADVRNLGNPYPAVEEPQQVIFVDERGEQPRAVLAYSYVSETGRPELGISVGIDGLPRQGGYDKRLVIVDAVTGAVIHQESLVFAVDVTGNVKGKATPGLLPDKTNNPPVEMALPNVTVQIIGGNSANTNALGDFVISHGGGQQVTVRSRMFGPSLLQGVSNSAGTGNIQIDLNVLPPGPADFMHNDVPAEFNTAQVNAMLHTALIHSRVGEINPAYPQLNRSFLANVNLSSTCNAFYNGSSINFYRRGGGCWNTAYTTVVYHEYGHKLVGDAGTNQGAYGEGQSDVMAIVMTEHPIVGEDFFESGADIRDARDGRQYPCSGGIHFCGQILSGCAYFTQEALRLTEPTEYRNILADLALNSILFRPPGIDPGITIDWLTLDDDDNNLGNGTPHYNEIDDGFSRHNMDPPPLALLDFNYPNGRPELIDPNGGTTFRVEVAPINGQPQSGTGRLHYNTGSGWVDIAMTEVQSNIYDATFPAIDCGEQVAYYVSARTTTNELVTDPGNAPNSTFSTISAISTPIVFEDNFETDKGWTVQNENLADGPWERGVPAGGGIREDPPSDFDGSGRCFVTDNASGNSDVDGGPTRLISPTIDMSAGDAIVRYACWFRSVNGAADRFTVQVSNDNGNTWVTAEDIGNQATQWVVREFRVSDFITPTSTMKLRFNAVDNPNDSVVEAGIDAIEVLAIDCGGGSNYTLDVTGTCPGTVTVAWSNADPNVQQGIVFGTRLGNTTIPGGVCQGTVLGIAGSVRLVQTVNSGSGSGSVNGQANSGACGGYLQLVQASNCAISNPDQVPN